MNSVAVRRFVRHDFRVGRWHIVGLLVFFEVEVAVLVEVSQIKVVHGHGEGMGRRGIVEKLAGIDDTCD